MLVVSFGLLIWMFGLLALAVVWMLFVLLGGVCAWFDLMLFSFRFGFGYDALVIVWRFSCGWILVVRWLVSWLLRAVLGLLIVS